MASGWLSSRQSAWGGSASGDGSPKPATLLVIGLLIFAVGAAAGFELRSSSGGTSANNNVTSPVIDPDVNVMKAAPKTPQGAVEAVTSYITGYPAVALGSVTDENNTIDDIVAPNADPNLKQSLKNVVDAARQRLAQTGVFQTAGSAKLVTTPASYKVDMLAADRARVQVWFQAVFIDSNGQTADSTWATNDIQVQWTDHWRLSTFAARGGPTPTLYSDNSQPSPFTDIAQVVNGFQAYRYATSAATK